jgi:hypothetical protein
LFFTAMPDAGKAGKMHSSRRRVLLFMVIQIACMSPLTATCGMASADVADRRGENAVPCRTIGSVARRTSTRSQGAG